MSRRVILIVISIAVFSVIAYWFVQSINTEFKTVQYYDRTSPSKAASENHLLAAEKFIHAMDTAATSVPTTLQLPPIATDFSIGQFEPSFATQLPDNATVILGSTNLGMSKNYQNQLFDWVAGGGYLIVNGGTAYDLQSETTGNPILDQLGVHPYRIPYDEPINEAWLNAANSSGSAYFGSQNDNGNTIPIAWRDDTLYQLDINSAYYLELQYQNDNNLPVWSAGDARDNLMMLFAHGNGYIMVLSDMDWISNDELGKHDHAKLFWAMLHPNGFSNQRGFEYNRFDTQQRPIWLQFLQTGPRWWQLLWNHAWPLVIGVVLLVLLLLWMATLRLGTVISATETGRRSLLEHVIASANFRWKSRQRQQLLAHAREHTLQHVRRRHPSWRQLTDDERVELLAEHHATPAAEIKQALFKTADNQRGFTAAIRTLQHLEHN